MHPEFQRLMSEATRLVREGDPLAATAAIQAALRERAPSAADAPDMPPAPSGIVVDVEARDVTSPRLLHAEPDAPYAPPPSSRFRVDTFVAGRFSDARAQRDYKLYVPPQAGMHPLPLVVMLHGCTQDPDDFAAGTRMNDAARSQGCFVLYPAQSQRANPQRCWNWFKHSHQQRGRGEPALLASLTRDVMAAHRIDPDRVYVAGLSAGGAMAAILGETYPDLYAAVGVHSGLAAGAASDLPSALAAMRSGAATPAPRPGPPTIVFHGDADATVHPANGDHVIAARVRSAHARPEVERQSAGRGRGYTRRVHRAPGGDVLAEHWVVHGSGHAWSGGSRDGTYTDPSGPDATGEMLRFFLQRVRG